MKYWLIFKYVITNNSYYELAKNKDNFMDNITQKDLLDLSMNVSGSIYETITDGSQENYNIQMSQSGGSDNQLFEIDFKNHKRQAGRETHGTATLGPHSHNKDFAGVIQGITEKGELITDVAAQISLAGGDLTNKNYILNFTRDHTVLNEEPIQMEINGSKVTLPAGANQLDVTKYLTEGSNQIELLFPGNAERDHGMKSMQLITI